MTNLSVKGEATYKAALLMAQEAGLRPPPREDFDHITDERADPQERPVGPRWGETVPNKPLDAAGATALERMKSGLAGAVPPKALE